MAKWDLARQKRMPRGYDEQTYASPYWFVRIPHRMRYRAAVKAISAPDPPGVLDYGAGDGKLLLDIIDAGVQTKDIVAFEPVERYRNELTAAVERHGERVRVVGDREDLRGESFDVIACLGVLEHMPLLERQAFYDICDNTLRPGGRIFVDVPVEIGPTLVIKALTRQLLKGRAAEYDARSLLRIALGQVVYDPARFDPADTSTWIHDHKGFDYRLFRAELAHRFDIVEEHRTPVPWLPATLGNQEVYFTAVSITA